MRDAASTNLFRQLGRDNNENQLSRSFAACFRSSPFFRQEILRLLHKTCGLPPPTQSNIRWECVTETSTPIAGGGRLDLVFKNAMPEARRRTPQFVIENKVGSTLTLEQLRRYRQHDVKHLIAVTKNPPEVPLRQMKREGIYALRWQDFHRHLCRATPTSPVDRFIRNSFVAYLEDLNMAYPENLPVKQLKECGRILQIAGSSKKWEAMEPKNGFAAADQCLQISAALKRELIERIPALAGFHVWGPTFYTNREAEDAPEDSWCGLGWNIYGKRTVDVHFGCHFWFPRSASEQIGWCVELWGKKLKHGGRDKWITLRQMTDRRGYVNEDLLLNTLTKAARDWRVATLLQRK